MTHYPRITEYSEPHNGLLKTRADMFNKVERITERLAEIRNSVKELDKTLRLVGCEGELDAIMPTLKRNVMLELRHAEGPFRSRELAQNVLATLSRRI